MKLRNVISGLIVCGSFVPGVAFAGEPVVVDDSTERADDFEPDGKRDDARRDDTRPDDEKKSKRKRRGRDDDEEEGGEVDRDRDDRARFRGGIAGEGGAIVIPTGEGTVILGAAGVHGQLGAQITNLVGVYFVPTLDVLFGEAGGLGVAAAVIVDFTIEDMVSIGVGPDVGAFAAFGVTIGGANSATFAGGANAGARIHLAVYPYVAIGDDGIRRKALEIGLDTRLLGGFGVAASCVGDCAEGESSSTTNFVFSPMLSIGYTAF